MKWYRYNKELDSGTANAWMSDNKSYLIREVIRRDGRGAPRSRFQVGEVDPTTGEYGGRWHVAAFFIDLGEAKAAAEAHHTQANGAESPTGTITDALIKKPRRKPKTPKKPKDETNGTPTKQEDLTPEEAQAAVDEYINGASTKHLAAVPDVPAKPKRSSKSKTDKARPKPDLSDVEGEETEAEKLAQIDKLVRLVVERAKLFHAPGLSRYDFYADIDVNGCRETHYIGSSSLNRWMLSSYYAANQKALGQSVVDGANGVLRALAEQGPEMTVDVRTSQHEGRYYIDLADKSWKAVEISPDGWKVMKAPPVRFKRGSAMAPLCEPKPGGSLELLREFLNLKDEDSFKMLVAWLLAALRAVGPYPILVINGEQGSAKSTMTKILRSLVDPSTAMLRHASASDRDLFITAMHSWVLAFDNCSHIQGWLSDALCRLATGGGFATRALYTDVDEVVFDSKRPIILNGITEFVERGDLADRSVFVHLTPIAKTERRTERDVLGKFEKVRPLILGALFDAMAEGLRNLPSTHLENKPRMAEFAEWATACEAHYAPNQGDFLDAYERNQAVAVAAVVESDDVARAIQDFAYELGHKDESHWEGNATELLKKLNGIVDEATLKERSWPKSSKSMGRAVARVAPVLRQAGIPVKRAQRTSRTRTIVIEGVKRATEKRGEFDD